MSGRRVCAIVVTWHPDADILQRLVSAVGPQVAHLVVVDNGGTRLAARDGVTLLPQPVNAGLAAGFNTGIAFARAGGFDTVLLLDQDSEPKPGMVQSLIHVLDEGSRRRAASRRWARCSRMPAKHMSRPSSGLDFH